MSTVVTKTRFDAAYPNALAMYCSDGRFTEAIEELFHTLGHPRLDTMTLPGGPCLIDITSSNIGSVEGLRASLSFLVEAHHIRHVVLVAHASCGYYKHRFPYESPESMLRRQLADLRAAERWVRGAHKGVDVRSFYARAEGGGVSFESVEAL